jgi:hyperosmotically inducible protein
LILECPAGENSSIADRHVLNFTSVSRPMGAKGQTWRGKCILSGMFRNHSIPRFAALAGVLFAGLTLNSAMNSALAQNPPQPDNTRVNKQDKVAGAVTADQQKDNRSDRELTQQIRKAVVADKSLSTYAHNVKVVAQGGAVTLKGPVRSEEEKKAIVAKAEEVAGAGKVTDQLSIKPAQ